MRKFLKVTMKMDAWPKPRASLIPIDCIYLIETEANGSVEIVWDEKGQAICRTHILESLEEIEQRLEGYIL